MLHKQEMATGSSKRKPLIELLFTISNTLQLRKTHCTHSEYIYTMKPSVKILTVQIWQHNLFIASTEGATCASLRSLVVDQGRITVSPRGFLQYFEYCWLGDR